MTLAAVRVRGTVNVRGDIKDTLRMLRLNRTNHCVIVPENPYYRGMLNKVKDYITWGEVDVDSLTMIIFNYGYVKDKKLKDSYIKKNTKYTSLRSYAKALCDGKEVFSRLRDVRPVLRLHPPIKGYEGIKRPFKDGGALGNRGPEINKLLQRMILKPGEKPAIKKKKEKVFVKKRELKVAKKEKIRKAPIVKKKKKEAKVVKKKKTVEPAKAPTKVKKKKVRKVKSSGV
ncbi:MAG: 50S ribosomal protein L30 [Thermoplasmata archaeon]|nr:50S ribosomal protein L30 [Thermoplasmata archaeon]